MQEYSSEVNEKFEALFEKVSRFFDQHSVLYNELISAKDSFFSMTGKIGVEDNEFGNRMNDFLLWFLFDYKLPSTLTNPVDYFITHLEKNKMEEDLQLLQAQKKHIHSLFFFVKQKKDLIIVKDLYTGKKHNIPSSRVLIGQEKDAYFETRIFELNGENYFANYFIYHPIIVRKNIKRKVKEIRKKRESIKPFLLKLHAYHTKWQRYRNIDIKSIYHFDKSVPEAK